MGKCDQRRQKANDEAGRREFARLMKKALRQAGELGRVEYDPSQFMLVSKRSRRVMWLHNAYEAYLVASKRKWKEVLRRIVAGWFFSLEKSRPTRFEEMKPGLMPIVRSCTGVLDLSGSEKAPGADVDFCRFGEHFAVQVVYDHPEVKVDLHADELSLVGTTFAEAYEVARRNLAEASREGLARLAPGVWRSAWRDSYDAARLVLLDVVRRHPVKGDHVAMVPNPYALLVTGSEDEAGLALMASLAEQGLEHPHAISGVALRLNGDHWTPFLPGVDHPTWRRLKQMQLDSLRRIYTCQAALLPQQERYGFFASYHLVETEPGKPASSSVWSNAEEGVLLPRTDTVSFVRVDAGGSCELAAAGPWELVQQVVGHLMEPVGLYPERYRVRSFPDQGQLAAIGMHLPVRSDSLEPEKGGGMKR